MHCLVPKCPHGSEHGSRWIRRSSRAGRVTGKTIDVSLQVDHRRPLPRGPRAPRQPRPTPEALAVLSAVRTKPPGAPPIACCSACPMAHLWRTGSSQLLDSVVDRHVVRVETPPPEPREILPSEHNVSIVGTRCHACMLMAHVIRGSARRVAATECCSAHAKNTAPGLR